MLKATGACPACNRGMVVNTLNPDWPTPCMGCGARVLPPWVGQGDSGPPSWVWAQTNKGPTKLEFGRARRLLREGKLPPTTPVWVEGDERKVPARQLPALVAGPTANTNAEGSTGAWHSPP